MVAIFFIMDDKIATRLTSGRTYQEEINSNLDYNSIIYTSLKVASRFNQKRIKSFWSLIAASPFISRISPHLKD